MDGSPWGHLAIWAVTVALCLHVRQAESLRATGSLPRPIRTDETGRLTARVSGRARAAFGGNAGGLQSYFALRLRRRAVGLELA
jgi:hypothetical protein